MGKKVVATNPKARFNFEILEEYEAGIVLKGSEMKSVRQGAVSIKDSLARIQDEEVYLFNMHIAPYSFDSYSSRTPGRVRKLLLNKGEIVRLQGKIREKGLTLVPLEVYIKNGYAKVLLGLARGKREYDRRRQILEREQKREIERALKKSFREKRKGK